MEEINKQPDWQVLLIGGSAGVGKTELAKALARHFGVGLTMADDFRLVMQAATTPAQQPDLHFFIDPTDPQILTNLRVGEYCAGLVKVANIVSKSLESVIAYHTVVKGNGVIIEGDSIIPDLAAQNTMFFAPINAQVVLSERVRSVFLFEPSEQELLHNMQKRRRGFENLSPQQMQVAASAMYGQWLRQEAESYHLPVLEPRPWDTLVERVLAVLDESHRPLPTAQDTTT